MRRLLRLSVLALPLFAAGCQEEGAPDPEDAAPTVSATPGYAPELGVDLAASTQTPSGLYYRDLVVGDGAEATPGRRVAVHYKGQLVDGSFFDANVPGERPLTFLLGSGTVIQGWDEGIAGMRVGGKRQLVIPPELAYGDVGQGAIPPDATLVFTVDLVGVQE